MRLRLFTSVLNVLTMNFFNFPKDKKNDNSIRHVNDILMKENSNLRVIFSYSMIQLKPTREPTFNE